MRDVLPVQPMQFCDAINTRRKYRHLLYSTTLETFLDLHEQGTTFYMIYLFGFSMPETFINAGFAVKADGEGCYLFNNSSIKNLGEYLFQEQIKHGMDHFNCFDVPFLLDIYKRNGFEETGREPFNDALKSPLWDVEKHGRPDLIHMKLKKG